MGLKTNKTGVNYTAELFTDLRKYQPAKGNFFTLQILGVGDLVKASYDYSKNPTEDDYIGGTNREALNTEAFMITCTKATTPKCTIAKNEIRRGNEVIKHAGVPTWEDITVECIDYVDLPIKDILYALKAQGYYTGAKAGGRAFDNELSDGTKVKGYKHEYILTQYTADREFVCQYKIYGGWIPEINEQDYDVENDDIRRLSFTLTYDYAEYSSDR